MPGRFIELPEYAGSEKQATSNQPSLACFAMKSRQTADWLSQESKRPPTWLAVETRV